MITQWNEKPGLPAMTGPVATSLAVSMVPDEKRPTAIATVLAGYTLAFLIGMPLGSVIGDAFGWRMAFWFAAAISMFAFLLIAVGAPKGVVIPIAGGNSFKSALAGEKRRIPSWSNIYLAT